ncbi:MAG: PEP-CTERM sorting domain-containing protein, partial [Pirellulales bacterium]
RRPCHVLRVLLEQGPGQEVRQFSHFKQYQLCAVVLGSVYISGGTDGNLGGPNAGVGDVFLAKINDSSPTPLLGDMDVDGEVDFDDIVAFVLAANDSVAYTDAFGVPPALHGDTDRDGDFDHDDIAGFVMILGGETEAQSAQLVPEPSTIGLTIIGLLALCGRAGWRRASQPLVTCDRRRTEANRTVRSRSCSA